MTELRRLVHLPFDLSPARCCACTCSTGQDRHTLLFVIHHIVSDGWSLGYFLSTNSSARTRCPRPVRHLNFPHSRPICGLRRVATRLVAGDQLQGSSLLEQAGRQPCPARTATGSDRPASRPQRSRHPPKVLSARPGTNDLATTGTERQKCTFILSALPRSICCSGRMRPRRGGRWHADRRT